LQKAILRDAVLPSVEEILTVNNRELFFKTEDEWREVNHTNIPTSYILEPFGQYGSRHRLCHTPCRRYSSAIELTTKKQQQHSNGNSNPAQGGFA
jgi:hypothetical protein